MREGRWVLEDGLKINSASKLKKKKKKKKKWKILVNGQKL